MNQRNIRFIREDYVVAMSMGEVCKRSYSLAEKSLFRQLLLNADELICQQVHPYSHCLGNQSLYSLTNSLLTPVSIYIH